MVSEVDVPHRDLRHFGAAVGGRRLAQAEATLREARERLGGRTVWNVNSTARGGGVAEMMRPVLGYARDAGIDARWLVIDGNPEFFGVTKRLHHALHGSAGDGTELGEHARSVYEKTLAGSASGMQEWVKPGDVVILHDPQTAGLAGPLREMGAAVVWRCHVGSDVRDDETVRAWAFLAPYLQDVDATIFSRAAYIPPEVDQRTAVVIQPSLDPFSTKNSHLEPAEVEAILVRANLLRDGTDPGPARYRREDGSEATVDREAEVMRQGPPPLAEPLIVQVSRWDPLKDFEGLIAAFAAHASDEVLDGAQLVLAGPGAGTVSDDPEAAATYERVVDRWRSVPSETRERIHIATLPMDDLEENAAIVNALQRKATVVVQKSLYEGFGLTVTEAMWKGKPVVASRTGGIQDQIRSGITGLLVQPDDVDGLGIALGLLLRDPGYSQQMGERARTRVRECYLTLTTLERYALLLEQVESGNRDDGFNWPIPC